MKTTKERLNKVYCRPQTDDEWVRIKRLMPWGSNALGTVTDIVRCYYLYGSGKSKQALCHPFKHELETLTEIPSLRFIDLLQDKIVPWRLEEDGFKPFDHAISGVAYEYRCNDDVLITYVPLGEGLSEFYLWPTDIDGETSDESVPLSGIKTYTDILTLIRLIG